MLDQFQARPDVQIVPSRAILIDEHGARLTDSRWNRHGKFLPGFWRNVFWDHYQSAAMAICSSLLGPVLPFPHRRLFLHDTWIGTSNEAAGGKNVFLDEPLLYYRCHSHNANGTHSLWQILKIRIDLVLAHLLRIFQRSRRKDGFGASSSLNPSQSGDGFVRAIGSNR
jgi:hypothetical protein